MCCETCPHYDECEERESLKEGCCSQCPERTYCKEEGEGFKWTEE